MSLFYDAIFTFLDCASQERLHLIFWRWDVEHPVSPLSLLVFFLCFYMEAGSEIPPLLHAAIKVLPPSGELIRSLLDAVCDSRSIL